MRKLPHSHFRLALVTGLFFCLAGVAEGQGPPVGERSESPGAPAPGAWFDIERMARAAEDLRKAGEAFERFGGTIAEASVRVSESLARMSAEFDPLGYKAAFDTVRMQTEIIQSQNRQILELREREISRLREENQTLRKRLHELQGRENGRGQIR